MNKAKFVKLVPEKKNMVKEHKANQKQLAKLAAKVEQTDNILRELEGVELVETEKGPFPVRIQGLPDSPDTEFEVWDAVNPDGRYAYVQDDPAGDGWLMEGYASETGENVGDAEEFKSKGAALKAGALFVATGRSKKVAPSNG